MASVNKVMLLGNLGADPESRTFPNGDAVCNFSIATSCVRYSISINQHKNYSWSMGNFWMDGAATSISCYAIVTILGSTIISDQKEGAGYNLKM